MIASAYVIISNMTTTTRCIFLSLAVPVIIVVMYVGVLGLHSREIVRVQGLVHSCCSCGI